MFGILQLQNPLVINPNSQRKKYFTDCRKPHLALHCRKPFFRERPKFESSRLQRYIGMSDKQLCGISVCGLKESHHDVVCREQGFFGELDDLKAIRNRTYLLLQKKTNVMSLDECFASLYRMHRLADKYSRFSSREAKWIKSLTHSGREQ